MLSEGELDGPGIRLILATLLPAWPIAVPDECKEIEYYSVE